MSILLRLEKWIRQRLRRKGSTTLREEQSMIQQEYHKTRIFLQRLNAVGRRNKSVLAELTALLKNDQT